jgi:hypothetical protein
MRISLQSCVHYPDVGVIALIDNVSNNIDPDDDWKQHSSSRTFYHVVRPFNHAPWCGFLWCSLDVPLAQGFFSRGQTIAKFDFVTPDVVIAKHFQSRLKKMKLAWATSIKVISLELIELYAALGFGMGLSLGLPNRRLREELRVVPLRNFPPLTVAALWVATCRS